MEFLTQENELIFTPKIQALYFYASWMLGHKKMMVMINKIEEKYKDVAFLAIDTDHFKGLCLRFNIESIPTILVLKDSIEVKRINGLVLTSALRSAFADICNV